MSRWFNPYFIPQWRKWQLILDYWDGRCAVCGRKPDFWHCLAGDHWHPRGVYGANCVPLCHSLKGTLPGDQGCNNLKSDHDPEEWLISRYGNKKGRRIFLRVEAYLRWLKELEELCDCKGTAF